MNKSDEATPDTLKLTSCGECGQPNMAPFDFHDSNSCATYAVKNIEGILKSAGWLSYDAALAQVEELEIDYKLEREVLAADIGNLQQKVNDLREVVKKLEWKWDDAGIRRCLYCWGYANRGHMDKCKASAALAATALETDEATPKKWNWPFTPQEVRVNAALAKVRETDDDNDALQQKVSDLRKVLEAGERYILSLDEGKGKFIREFPMLFFFRDSILEVLAATTPEAKTEGS